MRAKYSLKNHINLIRQPKHYKQKTNVLYNFKNSLLFHLGSLFKIYIKFIIAFYATLHLKTTILTNFIVETDFIKNINCELFARL